MRGRRANGLDDLLQLAGSGRTSIPVNREIDPALYRTAGYRVCGERAVRVDILERLADLIRPALAWREGAAGAKPPGAIAGGGFTVVNGMTSLTGASGEDFASILRSLGYRMERRPKPQEPVGRSRRPRRPKAARRNRAAAEIASAGADCRQARRAAGAVARCGDRRRNGPATDAGPRRHDAAIDDRGRNGGAACGNDSRGGRC